MGTDVLGRKIYQAKRVIDETGGGAETDKGGSTHFEVDGHDGVILAGSAKCPGRKGTGAIPPAPAQVYYSRGKDSSREFSDETAAVQTIKIRFEKMIEKNTKEIDVPSLFNHTAHHFFLANPELAIIPIDPSGEDQRIMKKRCISPLARRISKVIFSTTDPSGRSKESCVFRRG